MKHFLKKFLCFSLMLLIVMSCSTSLSAQAENAAGRKLTGQEMKKIETKVLGALMKVGFDSNYSASFGEALTSIVVQTDDTEVRETEQSGIFTYYVKFRFVNAYNVYQELLSTNRDLINSVGLDSMGLISVGELLIRYDSAADKITRIENKGDVYTGLELYCISEKKFNVTSAKIDLSYERGSYRNPSETVAPTPAPTPVPTPVPVISVPSDELVYKAAHTQFRASSIYVDAIAARDGRNRFIVRINKGLAVTQYVLLIEFDYSARFYNIYSERYEPYSGEPKTDELEALYKSDADFHWGEEPWDRQGDNYRSYGEKGLREIESTEDLTASLSYGETIRVMAMRGEDISDLDDPEFLERITKEAGPTVPPAARPSEETVLMAVKEAWGTYSEYLSAEILEKDDYNHFIVKIRRDEKPENDIIEYVMFDPDGEQFVAFHTGHLPSYSASGLHWDRDPKPEEWINIFKYDSLFHWGLSLENFPNTEYFQLDGFDDYFYIYRISGSDPAAQPDPAPDPFIQETSAEPAEETESNEQSDAYPEMNASQDDGTAAENAELPAGEYADESSESDTQIIFQAKTVKPTNIRKAANKNSDLLRKIRNTGVLVDIIGTVTGDDGKTWYKLLLDNDMIGYARSDFFGEPIYAEAPDYTDSYDGETEDFYTSGSYPLTGRTNRGKVNIREETDKNSRLLATIPGKGTSVTVITDFTGSDDMIWYRVEYEGIKGFIRSDFIILDESESGAGSGNPELYGVAIKKLATRSAPSPYAEDTGTYFVEGQRIRIYTRAYDPIEGAWWVKCDIPYHGEIRTLWAWYTRFDSASLPLDSIPIENIE